MLFSLRIDLSFLLILHLCLKLLLFLNFDDDSPYESFKLGFVYGRQRPILFLPESHLPFEFAQTIPWPRDSSYKMLLVDLLESFVLLIGMIFFHISLHATLLSTTISLATQRLNMNIGVRQWQMNFKLFKKVKHGMFLVRRMLKLLVVHRFTQSSCILMEPSTAIVDKEK